MISELMAIDCPVHGPGKIDEPCVRIVGMPLFCAVRIELSGPRLAASTNSRSCRSCRWSGMEPSGEAVLICGHPDAGSFGLYIRKEPLSHCPSFSKWEQHPLRNPDGSLKEVSP